MESCMTCGMPFEGDHAGDIGLRTEEGPVCVFDIENGALKSAEAIFEGGITFFAQACTKGDRALAMRLTRRNMSALPYWIAHPFYLLQGEKATDDEWNAALASM